MATKIIDHDTKQLLLSAIDRRMRELVESANRHLQWAEDAEQSGMTATAISHRKVAEQDADTAAQLRRLWNDTKPVDVRVQLTGTKGA